MITAQHVLQLGSSLARLGPRRLAVLGMTGLAVMLAIGLAAHFLGRPAMQAIYVGLSAQDVSRITAALAEAGVSFDVNEQRSAVLVPFGQTARARTLLAQKGLPSSARAGYELFDQMGSMGLTSFMQEVTRVRALEGEIARTIQSLDGVGAARVHLVLPEAQSFRRERREPSASVLLRTDGRWQPAAGQVVRHVVAAAVPGMKVEQVSVASTDGRLLAASGDDSSSGSFKLAEMERVMAGELEQRASRTLASALGSGHYQISITASLDVDRQQVSETVFDPKSRVERSLRVLKQSGTSEDGGNRAVVGVEANVPREESGATESDKRRQREDKREELVNYELNSKTVQTVREGYRVKHLAVAVVVNRRQIAAQLGGSPDAGALDARIAEIKRLVSAATGARTEREDRVEVSAVDFGNVDGGLAAVPSLGFVDHLMMHLGTIVNAAALLGVVLVVVLLGLRPLTRALAPPAEQVTVVAPPKAATAGALEDGAARGPSPRVLEPPSLAAPLAAATGPQPQGREDVVRARLDALVAADDVKVARVLKSWMADGMEARRT
jgi:flagellar M-ring protein FliF